MKDTYKQISAGYESGRLNSHKLKNAQATLDALAYGVDNQMDSFHAYFRSVTLKTVELAQALGLPEKEIARWQTSRNKALSARMERMNIVLEKLRRNIIAGKHPTQAK